MTPAEQIEHVRKRPGMYLGGTSPNGVLAMVLEVVSNSFDVVLAGSATRIDVAVDEHGSITVADDGPGIAAADPQATVLPSFFTRVRTNPTADDHWPHVHLSVGTGLGPVCALSSRLHVEARRASSTVRQTFERGHAATELEHGPASADGATGTTIELTPDPEIFGDARVDLDDLAEAVQELAFLEPRLTTSLTTPGAGTEVFGPHPDLGALVAHRFADRRSLRSPEPPMVLRATGEDFGVEIALAWADHRARVEVESYGNYRRIREPGWELDGIEEGLREVFGPGPVRNGSRGVMAGLRAVQHVRLLDVRFPGPTGQRLASPEATWIIADVIAEQLPLHLERHPELAASLVARTNTRTHRAVEDLVL